MEAELILETRITKAPKTIKLLERPKPKQRVLTPVISSSQSSRLPPISPDGTAATYEQTAAASSLPNYILEQCKEEMEASMKHLLTEAQTVEVQIQSGVEVLWKRMHDTMERRTHEMQRQVLALKEELKEAQAKVSRLNSQEAALVQQNAKTSTQLTKEEKRRRELEASVSELKTRLDQNQKELNNLSSQFKERENAHHSELEKLHSQLNEKTATVKDYQLKISRLTEKMNVLSKDLTQEKSSSEKQQKSVSDQLAHQTSENRKLLLEISKLKATVASTNAALATVKEEKRKLEQESEAQQKDHEMTLTRINKSHATTVRELENQIDLLKKELENLKTKYLSETELLQKQLMDLQKEMEMKSEDKDDDYLEARIQFLRYQNKQEKVKLQKGKKAH